ncbi:cytochrome c [Rhodanobacter sp. MP7CTX1]|uniref:c-type cytochrome n=1 Tax=Rhodanobacter sp. MP7CTX1 TaxID=2723084 RepID=UPI00161177A4|nr:mono/diheme cytochrome c family protein [Rhodanobacter sp. MP7CTX1]
MKYLLIVLLLGVLAVIGFVGAGWYNVGADSPHWKTTYTLMQFARERSVAYHARDLSVPADLGDEAVILKGAGQYAAMCTGCHLQPGMKESEIRPGLYPQPPDLSQMRVDPKEAFWVIKHGIKMSAMPAWGSSHDDATIWSMVAFLQKLPRLTPAEYKAIVAKAPPDDDMEPMHDEHADPSATHDMSMPAAAASAAATARH